MFDVKIIFATNLPPNGTIPDFLKLVIIILGLAKFVGRKCPEEQI